MNRAGIRSRKQRELLSLSQAKLAEISGVSQQRLSAFELGKIELSPSEARKITSSLQNPVSVDAVVTRKKRYKTHVYLAVKHDPTRRVRHSVSKGNSEYLSQLKSLSASPPRCYSAISLFSGCGGLSLGFRWAGYDVVGFVEIEEAFRSLYSRNFPEAMLIGTDITKISDRQIHDAYEQCGDVDVIIGGPPCQGFSLSGKRNVHDPRNILFTHYFRFIDVFRPKLAVMENVRLLTSMKSKAGSLIKDEIRAGFAEHGYDVMLYEINAKDYGVPQHRQRVFFVAVRQDLRFPPSFPTQTHGQNCDLFTRCQPHRSFADACSDLPYLESGETSGDPLHAAVSHPKHVIDWLWDVKEGSSAHENVDPKKRPPSGYNTTYKRQVWLEPASTIQTTFGMISGCRNVHPIATRSLTIREAARIQSFPDEYQFEGAIGAIRTAIGNAVPPLLSFAVARHLSEKILETIEVPRLKVKL